MGFGAQTSVSVLVQPRSVDSRFVNRQQSQGKEPPGSGTYQTLAGADLVC